MLFKLAPPYLCDLCPNFVCERSSYSLCSANNLCIPFVRTERHKKSFLSSSIQEWNNLPLETRKLSSAGIFKRSLLKFLHFPSGSYLFCIGDRLAWIFHTRLRLNFSALNYHLFRKNCCPSPACALWDASIEDVKHYFLSPAQVLLLCVKSCLPPLQNYLEIDGIVPQIRKNRLAFKWYFYCWFSNQLRLSSRFFRYEIASVSCWVCYIYIYIFVCFFLLFFRFFLCVCSIVKCICIFKIFKCKQRKLSRWAL